MLYTPVDIENILDIQNEILERFEIPDYSTLFYPENNQTRFFNILPLKKELEKLNLHDKIRSFALITTPAGFTIPVHRDPGQYTYSFNIPISGYTNTFVNFYTINKNYQGTIENVVNQWGSGYTKYDIEYCKLFQSFESNRPYIMNTKVPHSISNQGNELRICLLIRLNVGFNPRDIRK